MPNLRLTLGGRDCDRVQPPIDGRARAGGARAS